MNNTIKKTCKYEYNLGKLVTYSILCAAFIFINFTLFAQDSTGIQIQDTTKVQVQDTTKMPEHQTIVEDSSKLKNAPIIAVLPDPNLDPKIFTTINYNRSSIKNTIVPVFDGSMAPMAFFMPVSMLLYGRLKDKTYEENTGYLLASSLVINTAVTFATKILVKRNRVRVTIVRYGIYPKIVTSADPFSFPSGHTSTSFAIATMFALRYPTYPLIYIPIYAWAMTIGYGRMYLGMHYPSDVLAGAIIGAGSSILIHSLRKELFKFKNNILSENKNDDGSINSGVISLFTAGFVSSILFNYFMPAPTSKLIINASPFHNNDPGIDVHLNYKF